MGVLWLLIRRTAQEYSADNCAHMAAAISYYVLFSIVPLAIFLASVFGFVVRDEALQEDVSREIVDFLDVEAGVPLLEPDRAAIEARHGTAAFEQVAAALGRLDDAEKEALAQALEDQGAVTVAGFALGPDELSVRSDNAVIDTIRGVSRVSAPLTLVGLLGVAWSASAMFGALRKSLNIAWDVEAHRPLVQQKLIDLGMVAGLGLLLAVSIAGTAALRTLRELGDENLGPLSEGTGFAWSVLPLFLPAVFSCTAFLLLYRYVPNVPSKLGDVWPGALLATVLFELLKNGFALYVAKFNNYAGAYGALGGILLFLLWTYLSASILLLGAELASEYQRLRRGEYATAGAPGRVDVRAAARGFVRGLFFRPQAGPPGRGGPRRERGG